jgi:predicted Zn-ribbon and HTH transcriptional regulator
MEPNTKKWEPIVDFPKNYEVSNEGDVRNSITGKILKSRGKHAYNRVDIFGKWYYVHKLVCQAFIGDCPQGHEINHKDSNKSNNNVSNLEYVTHLQNVQMSNRTFKNNGDRYYMELPTNGLNLPTITCGKCKYTFVPRVVKPKKCPQCGYRFEQNEESK